MLVTTFWWYLRRGSHESLEWVPELSLELHLPRLPWAGLGKGEFFKIKQTGIIVLFRGERKLSLLLSCAHTSRGLTQAVLPPFG